jgi:hypothetical protein
MRLWTHGTAEYSPCRRYRYTLTRTMNADLIGDDARTIAFIGLNPSTATATTDDPTVRRCIGYAAREGFGRFVMLNAFAYRATDPKDMKAQADPVGVGNDDAIARVASRADLVVLAWGAHATHLGRHNAVLSLLDGLCDPVCLGVTKAGLPKHPLYLRADAPFVRYDAPVASQSTPG